MILRRLRPKPLDQTQIADVVVGQIHERAELSGTKSFQSRSQAFVAVTPQRMKNVSRHARLMEANERNDTIDRSFISMN
jgi:hypothetical protein